MSTFAYVTPDVLRWARETAGFSTRDAAESLKVWAWQIEAAETGAELLTLGQAEHLAKLYERPLSVLFRPEPPVEDPPEAQFRRLPGAPDLPWPAEMHKLARRIRGRQQAAEELLELLGDNTAWQKVASRLRRSEPDQLADVARQLLNVSIEEQTSWLDPSGYTALRSWVDSIEALGILVMQDGHMPPETMRGFASPHSQVPAIVTNTKDDPRARAFTAVHELGHLAWTASGAPGAGTEAWCNQFAGAVLMPAREFRNRFTTTDRLDLEARVHKLALTFGVTPLAAAVRIDSLGLLAGDRGDQLVREIRGRPGAPRDPGGNFYLNKVAWLGPTFIRLVLEAVDEQAVTLSNAAGLLGAKVSQFDRLRQTIENRVETGG